jgi:hypothetical protein
MNKTFSFSISSFLLAGLLFVSSCSKKDETKTVTYAVTKGDFCAGFYGSGDSYSNSTDINLTDIQQAFLASGLTYDPTKVTTAKLTGLQVKTVSGTPNFNDVKSIDVYIKIAGASGNGELIASASSFTAGSSSVNLNVAGKELKGFLDKSCELTTILKSDAGTVFNPTIVCVELSNGVISAEVLK